MFFITVHQHLVQDNSPLPSHHYYIFYNIPCPAGHVCSPAGAKHYYIISDGCVKGGGHLHGYSDQPISRYSHEVKVAKVLFEDHFYILWMLHHWCILFIFRLCTRWKRCWMLIELQLLQFWQHSIVQMMILLADSIAVDVSAETCKKNTLRGVVCVWACVCVTECESV